MSARDKPSPTLWWSAVVAAAVLGLALRIAAAQGGFWTDEAWSMIYAHDARNAAGVFLRINHDNNHHLYSLWLQAIGLDAPAWLARLPAILAGTAAIVVAALLAARSSAWAGVIAAMLFALSPSMVTFGSEARGYALMLLAALVMLLVVTRAIDRGSGQGTPWWLALVAALGMLSHMTMAVPVGLITLWVYVDRRAAVGPAKALPATAVLMGPALGATAAVVAFVFAAAALSPTGMRVGGYLPFQWSDYGLALDDLSGWTLGASALAPWIGPLVVGGLAAWIAWRPPAWLGSQGRLYAILVLGLPLAVALFHPGNSGFARYYLCSALGLLLLASLWIGHGLARPGIARAVACSAVAAISLISLWHDSQLLRAERGHPDGAVEVIAEASPAGARVALDPLRLEAITTVAAFRDHYPLTIVGGCAPADYVVSAQARFAAPKRSIVRCGVRMRALGSDDGTALTGDRWTVYGRQSLQTTGAPDSGPPPGGAKRRLFSRAGVAQG